MRGDASNPTNLYDAIELLWRDQLTAHGSAQGSEQNNGEAPFEQPLRRKRLLRSHREGRTANRASQSGRPVLSLSLSLHGRNDAPSPAARYIRRRSVAVRY